MWRSIDITNQDVCVFYNDHALYPNFGGVVIADDEGAKVAKYLGHKKALILQNHGILTVGETVEETVAWFIKSVSQSSISSAV
jgi:ribulose-5-phosphate 4-epimerase/fuculose-1-phosphate aldolase